MAFPILLPATTMAAHLRGQILHVGFPASRSSDVGAYVEGQDADFSPVEVGTHHYRPGAWTPVCVELTNDDGDRFEGRIEVRQEDPDGDEIIAKRDVVVQGTRRFFLYVPAGVRQERVPFLVRVYDTGGQLAPLFDDRRSPLRDLRMTAPMHDLSPDALVVLDISATPLNMLRPLLRRAWQLRELAIARSSPAELPDDAAGLDMADIIVWDAADPTAMDLPQRNALIEWVRRGGTLVIGAGKNWELLAKSRFAEILPAALREPRSLAEPPSLLSDWIGLDPFGRTGGRFSPPLVYCPITEQDLLPGASIVAPREADWQAAKRLSAGPQPGSELIWATRRPCGTGNVVLVAAEIRALVAAGENRTNPLCDILGLRISLAAPPQDLSGWHPRTDLFGYIRRMTTFSVTAWLYLLLAIAFVSVYILAAVVGSWAWLRRRNLLHQTWLAFAALAVIASVVSVGAVRVIRGISYNVQEFSVVDGLAGGGEVTVRSYLGLKAPTNARLDLRIPANWQRPDEMGDVPTMLRPMPAASGRTQAFMVSDRYEAVASLGDLRSVPLRATLKQFESQWHGPLDGTFTASLQRVKGDSGELALSSWVENGLKTDLQDCWLLVAWRNPESKETNRDRNIEAYPLGTLRRGQRLALQELADEVAAKLARQGETIPPGERQPPHRRLADYLENEWLRALVPRTSFASYGGDDDAGARDAALQLTAENFARAARVLSIFQEIPMDGIGNAGWRKESEILRSWGQRLDRSEQLTRNFALFIGVSRSPGPVRLCYRHGDNPNGRWHAISPSQANVVYRFLVPVSLPASLRDAPTFGGPAPPERADEQ